MEKISRGTTFKGYVSTIGSVVFVIGLVLLFVHYTSIIKLIIASIFIVSGAISCMAIRGIIIDVENKSIKPYFDILVAKIGKWEAIDQYDTIVLKYINESQAMHSRGNSSNIQTKSFDIYLSSSNTKELLIAEFINYQEAQTCLHTYATKLHKTPIDRYQLMLQELEEHIPYVRR